MKKPGLEGPFGRLLNAAVFVGALATVPVIILLEQGVRSAWLTAADWFIWSVFLLEFAIELGLSVNRRSYMRKNWFSPIVLVLSFPLLPDLLGTVRLARLARVMRFARLAGVTLRGLTELRAVLASRGLAFLALTTFALIVAGGAAVTVLEPQTTRGGVVDGIWWAVVTASTVGYGDISPSTPWGRMIAVVLMLAGVGLISTLGACITSYFVGQQENAEFKELRERTKRIEGMLEELMAERRADNQSLTATAGAGESLQPTDGHTPGTRG
jgi:voltage-gated potassium channel